MEYLYFICTLPIALIALLLICDLYNDRQNARRYQEYIDSIRVGDIFEPNFLADLNDDPFNEIDRSVFYGKTIIDIKKNKKGETWVKYIYLKQNEDDISSEYTEEIHRFAKNQKRIKQSEI